MNIKVSELTFEQFLDWRSVWNDSLQRSIDKHVFLTWEWLSSWWRLFGKNRELLVLVVEKERRIVAAAPLMVCCYRPLGLSIRKVEFIATPASDYHTFLLEQTEPKYGRAILQYGRKRVSDWECIELREIPETSQTARLIWNPAFEENAFRRRVQSLCYGTALPLRFEDYLRGLDRKFRQNMRRGERNLKKDYKVDFKICSDASEVKEYLQVIMNLHQKRWRSRNEPGIFSDPRTSCFHHEISRLFFDRGWLVLNLVTLNDVPVAGGYDFTYQNRLYSYVSGFDPGFSRYDISNLRYLYLLEYCAKKGIEEWDMMRGDEPYKEKWNTLARRKLELWVTRKRIVPILYDAITKDKRFSALAAFLGKHISSRSVL